MLLTIVKGRDGLEESGPNQQHFSMKWDREAETLLMILYDVDIQNDDGGYNKQSRRTCMDHIHYNLISPICICSFCFGLSF